MVVIVHILLDQSDNEDTYLVVGLRKTDTGLDLKTAIWNAYYTEKDRQLPPDAQHIYLGAKRIEDPDVVEACLDHGNVLHLWPSHIHKK